MRNVAIILIQALGTFSVLATFLPILNIEEWYVRVFDFPRLQLFGLAILSLALYLWLGTRNRKRDKLLIAALAIAIIYQAVNIYPYTFLAPEQVKLTEQGNSNADLSLLVANVLMENEEHDKLIEQVRQFNPDILLMLESDEVWQEAMQPVTQKYLYRVEIPLKNTYGMHLYSQLPLRQQKVNYLLDKEIPSIKTFVKLRSGTWVELHAVHPKPPVPTEDPTSKKRDAEIVLVGRDVKDSEYPVIVAGDFNDVAWSHTTELFQEVSGLLDPRLGRGFFNTFNSKYPLLRWPLDHVFHSKHFALVSIKRLPDINSDHFPIYIKLRFDPENVHKQQEPKQDADTQEEAAETVQEGKEEAQKEK